ncbi:MAG: class II aldolase/adducin family protein [Alicyclobacillus macrosporangiidus]|uniref:class II aldolase/adducin family protein n=1 Tax=Alicyclobacillus macrosporangiidus TaxID=392015 RepID=UPI0026E961D4|nr:class II aldolase/adducin family protein [Alicyclobacillus macrosporangiidus]MCL6599269.1 class II aldolase/adducin family protein [Alicyclobacillus macrosporangiidus]
MSGIDDLKRAVIAYARKMARDKLVTGTSGNISCLDRENGLVIITPTSVDYDDLEPDQISVLDLDGNQKSGLPPSSETPMHLSIYHHRPGTHAIVHTHSLYATTFAVLGEPIPPIHYMVTALGGEEIPITRSYELYGTDRLAQAAVAAMGDHCNVVLLRNHGAVAVGKNLAEAYKNAVILEEMAQLYFNSKLAGRPVVLTRDQVVEVMTVMKAAAYGQSREETFG